MKTERFISRERLFLILMGLVLLLRVGAWILSSTILPPSSDESITMLQAGDIFKGRFPLLFAGQPYMFPLESYLAMPFSLLPPSPWACRMLPLLLGLLTTALAFHALPREGSTAVWCWGILLVVLPSVYILMLQGFYSPPGYATLMLACVAIPQLALRARDSSSIAWAFVLGIAASLEFASHSLSLCASLPSLAVLVLRSKKENDYAKKLLMTTFGLALGALPYLVARITIPGAHALASETRPLLEMVHRIWEPLLIYVLPGAMGFRVVPFPDTPLAGPFPSLWLANSFGVAIVLLLAILAYWRIITHLPDLRACKWPRLEAADIFFVGIVLNLLIFIATPRSDGSSFRYLAPIALLLPLVLGIAIIRATTGVLYFARLYAMVILGTQLHAGIKLFREWKSPGFALQMGLPDLRPAFSALDQQGIRTVIASYGAAYRINYESGGRIAAMQPQNERFPLWPVPIITSVAASPSTAYVLTDAIRFLKPDIFERHLGIMNMTALVQTAGFFKIYSHFKEPTRPSSREIDRALIRATANSGKSADLLHDGLLNTRWNSHGLQSPGDSIELTWSNERPLDHLTVYYPRGKGYPKTMQIELRQKGVWQTLPKLLAGDADKFEIRNGRPDYSRPVIWIDLNGEMADGLRLEIVTPRLGQGWSIAELKLFERDP